MVDLTIIVLVGKKGAFASNIDIAFWRSRDLVEIKVIAWACNEWRSRDMGRTGNMISLSLFETLPALAAVKRQALPVVTLIQEIDAFVMAKEFRAT